MSRRNNNGGGIDFIIFLLVAFFILTLIVAAFNFILANIGGVLIFMIIFGLIVGIIIVVLVISNNARKKEEEKQRNLAIVNSVESAPKRIAIPTSTYFSNKEEKALNEAFRDFLKHQNELIVVQTHLDYLENKEAAFRTLGRNEEALSLSEQITQARSDLGKVQSARVKTYDSKLNNLFYRVSEVKTAYSLMLSKLPSQRVEYIGEFFQSPQIRTVQVNSSTALIFTPAYVLCYQGASQNIKIYQYKDVSVSSRVTTELLKGNRQSTDEIEHIGYLYETKDGRRDMRYSYQNNPSYTYVYRGTATVRCGSVSYEQKFSNKSLTEAFEKVAKDYLRILSGKYKAAVDAILAHSEEIESSKSIEEYMSKQAEAEKLKKALERAENEKREKIRLQQEAAEEAKRKREEEERYAYELECKRKAELLRNISIVDDTVVSWYGSNKDFSLPEGLAKKIGTAFRWKTNLEVVVLPEGITEIGDNAFYGTSSLRKVSLPSTVLKIGKEAFCGCSLLSDIVLPKGIKTIEEQLFGKCGSLRTIKIPVGVKKIEKGAFSGCFSLAEVIIPEGVTSIEDEAFENCSMLKKIVLPNTVTKLGNNVFAGCTALEHIVLGSGIKRVPEDCFGELKELVDVKLSSSIIEIGEGAFRNCQKLISIEPIETSSDSTSKGMELERMLLGASSKGTCSNEFNSLEKIGDFAFEDCFAFKGLDFKLGLQSIGDYAFANCRAIRNVNIPNTVKSMGEGAFIGCRSLNTVDGISNLDWKRKHCFTRTPWLASQAIDGYVIFDGYLEAYTGASASADIPSTVTLIGQSAFEDNSNIVTVHIPIGVVAIEELAFANCKRLKSVSIPDSVSRIEDNAFVGDPEITIQCSRGSNASAFRIRNKIPGEYVAKTREADTQEKTTTRKAKSSSGGLSGLSEDELRMVMEMRREKLAKKKAEQEKPVEPEVVEYVLSEYDASKVEVYLASDNRKITNNIFNLKFEQTEVVSESKQVAEYETFVVDSYGQTISNIRTINTNIDGTDLIHKVTYTLSAQEKFDKTAKYYIILRYKDAGLTILSKTQYQINIEFASDFDF